jgi:alkylation response protein AidB-like acyl-CoA dehydrogenase
MEFTHSEDRRMLGDTLRRFFSDQYPFETRLQVLEKAPFHLPEKWAQLAELGVLGALVSEADGGFGGEGFDIAVVFEELGRGLCPEPLFANLLCLRLLTALKQPHLVERIVGGAGRTALAVFEPDADSDLDQLATTASRSGEQWLLYPLIDGGGAGDLTLEQTPAECLSEDARAGIEAALDAGRLALCAEAVGIMDVLLPMTVDYLNQRVQFGQPIASFQALQHRVVDMAVEIEQCRSITILAASKLASDERARYVAMAKNLIGRSGTRVAEEVIQLHGGIGMTWEYPGSHYAKRLIMIDHQLGDQYFQLQRVAALAA